MKQTLHNVTFLELVFGVVLLSGIGATVAPDMVAAADESRELALWEKSGTVKQAHTMVHTAEHSLPTVAGLALSMNGTQARPDGVVVTVQGDDYVVPTFRNALCTKPTRSVNDKVACVGSIVS